MIRIQMTPTHVAEVVAGERSLAELAVQLEQVCAVKLEHLAAVKAELVHRRGDVLTAWVLHKSGFREARDFLVGCDQR